MMKVLIVTLLVCLPLCAQSRVPQEELLRIEDILQSGDLAGALHSIQSDLALHPRDGGLLNLRGIIHAQQNELTAARKDFADAVKFAPDLVPAWQNLARACTMQAGNVPSSIPCAVDSWQHVTAAKPDDTEALHSLALLYEQQGKTADARKALEHLALLDRKNPAHLLELARLASDQKDFEGALGYLAHARDIAPNDAQINFLFAKEAMELNLVVEARRSLDRALALDPQNPAYNFAQGFVLLRTRDAATATGYFRKFVDAKPEIPTGHYALGIAYFDSGDFSKAKAEMVKAVTDPKTSAGAEYFLGRMACVEDKLPDATEHLRKSIERLPTYSESHTELARVLMLEGNLPEARKQLDRALQLDPQSFQANERLLVLYRRTHDERAEKQAAVVKKLDGDRSRRADLMLRTIEFRP